MNRTQVWNLLILAAALYSLAGCKPMEQRDSGSAGRAANGPVNSFTVPGQMVAADSLYSIQLYRKGNPGSAPILELNSNQRLQLLFEILEFGSRQFQISFTHHNPDWSRSSMPAEFYQEGFFTLYLDVGQVSQNQRPDYRQYTYEFPNEEVSFLRSGNYMLRVEDAQNGHLMFTMPFFVYENEGTVRSSVETREVRGRDLRLSHRPVSRYQLPDIVDQPIFDLEFYYVQNQFWGRSHRANELDFSDEHEVQFELRTEDAFVGDYEFLQLPLNNLSPSNPRIFDTDPTAVPMQIQVMDDAQAFANTATGGRRAGQPDPGLRSPYANVFFSLDPDQDYSPQSSIYLIGDFNNWTIRSDYRLRYNSSVARWQTNGIIKQGDYSYKYVLLENGRLNDLAFDALFTSGRQEYHAFVYMRDSRQFYYRLLQVNHFFQDF